MSQVHIELSEETVRRLHAVATSRGASDEEVAAEAVIAYLAPKRRLSFAGAMKGGPADFAERGEEILRAQLPA